MIDIAGQTPTISSVTARERLTQHRAECGSSPVALRSAGDNEVVEDRLTFISTEFLTENVMKPKLVVLTVIAMTLGFVNLSASAFTPSGPMGESVPLSGAMRTIPIEAKTKYMNVTAHETVKFEANGKAFAIRFADALPEFDLNLLAPAGVIDHKVTVYVAPDPLYSP